MTSKMMTLDEATEALRGHLAWLASRRPEELSEVEEKRLRALNVHIKAFDAATQERDAALAKVAEAVAKLKELGQ